MTDRLIRLPEVIQITSISRTQIYRLIAAWVESLVAA